MFSANTQWMDGSPVPASQVQVSEQRKHCCQGMHQALCGGVIAAQGWTGTESLPASPCPSSLPAPPHVLRGLMVAHTNPVQQPRSEHPANANLHRCRAHTCAGLLGYNRLQQKQTSREKNEVAPCQKGDGEGWRTEGECRTGKQLAAFF